MRTLHVAPGDSAGGSLRAALRDAGRDDDLIAFRDDLSCGPIDSDSMSARAAWWSQISRQSVEAIAADLSAFWPRVLAAEERLVVWVGRRNAMEYAFYLAFADRTGMRHYSVIDVTDVEYVGTLLDGSQAPPRPGAATPGGGISADTTAVDLAVQHGTACRRSRSGHVAGAMAAAPA